MLAKQLQGAAKGVAVDSDFENVTLLLHGNGTNGAQNNTFTDGSSNAFSITRNGNTTQGTFSPYGSNWSNYFDGSGDYLQVTGSSNLAFGTGDFTVEMWLYMTTAPSANAYTLYDSRPANTNGNYLNWFIDTSSKLGVYINSSTIYTATGTISTNTWTHIAVSRSGTSLRVFINGTQDGSTVTNSTDLLNGTNRPIIAQQGFDPSGGTNWFPGYISNLRALKGTAQYTANFTPPTAPLTAITNTSLLTCQSNRFIDNSTNAFAITVNGNTSVQRFSPFSPTAAYASGTIGGSGYFDGTGDYLSITNDAKFKPGSSTNPFSIECWLYPTSAPGNDRAVFGNFKVISYPSNCDGFDLVYTAAAKLGFRWGNPAYADDNPNSSALNLNTWNHFVVCRNSSGSMSSFLNGARYFNTSTGTSITDSTASSFWIGWAGSISGSTIDPFPGYIAGFRMLKGSTAYDPTQTTLTVPTAPATSDSNTSLLCNFTNAGIIDNAMMNDLETVGNAQISTSVSKFGGGSMYFDGTGDWLVGNFASKDLYSFGTGNFTVEMWVYTSNLSNYQTLLDTRASDSQTAWCLFIDNTGKPYWYDASGVQLSSTAISSNTWTHLAIARSGSTLKMFLGGTEVFSGTNTNSQNPTGTFYVGRNAVNAFLYTGYIDDLRITKGVARYTANFTAPTAPFADQ